MQSCLICSSPRATLSLLPCQHSFHICCVFPWPISSCPTCNTLVDAIKLLNQPNLSTLKNVPSFTNNCKLFGIQRHGRWSAEELEYGTYLRSLFCSNALPLAPDTRLASFLGHILQCSSKRLRSKIKTGKQIYHSRPKNASYTAIEVAHIRNSLLQLSELEEKFLMSLKVESSSAYCVIIYQMHRYWQRNFVKLYKDHYNILSENSIHSVPISVPQSQLMAPDELLGLVSSIDLDNPNSHSNLITHLNQSESGLQCMSVISKTSTKKILSITNRFRSLLQELAYLEVTAEINSKTLEFIAVNVEEFLNCINGNPPVESTSKLTLIDDLGNDNIKVFCGSLWITLCAFDDYVKCNFLVCVDNSKDISVANITFSELDTQDAELLAKPRRHALVAPSRYEVSNTKYEKNRKTPKQSNVGDLDQTLDESQSDEEEPNNKRNRNAVKGLNIQQFSIQSSTAEEESFNYVLWLPDNDQHNDSEKMVEGQQDVGVKSNTLDSQKSKDGDIILYEDFSPRSESSNSMQFTLQTVPQTQLISSFCSRMTIFSELDNDANDSLSVESNVLSLPSRELRSLSFDAALKCFLNVVPFDIVEIWVPVVSREKTSESRLYFGGCVSSVSQLDVWSSYSRSFVFQSRVGIPGRVSVTQEPETFSDISDVSQDVYLRKDGAKSLSIHATVGISVQSTNSPKEKNRAVLIYYSRQKFNINNDLIRFLTDVMKDLRIDARSSIQADISSVVKKNP